MATRPKLGIRGQILLIALIPVAILTVILIFLIYRGTIIRGESALERQGQLLAAQLAANLEYALYSGAMVQIPAAIAATIDPSREILGTPVGRIIIVNQDNQTVFTSGSEYVPDSSQPHLMFAWLGTMEDVKRFQAPIYLDPLNIVDSENKDSRLLGTVFIEIPTAGLKAGWLNRFLWDLALVFAALCLAFGLASWIGWRLSNAIRELADAILRIKGGDFSIRLVRKASSEISTLQEGVTLAVESISQGKRRLEQALAEARAEHETALSDLRVQTVAAERANAAKSMFLAKISHEMRTPLYSIQGLNERLMKTPRNTEDDYSLRQIEKATETLYHTIGDILDFTHLEGGHYHPVAEPIDLWSELETITETVSVLTCSQGLYLDIIVEPGFPQTVIGDPKAFRVIATNLVSNAVKFTERGGLCIRMKAGTQPLSRSVEVLMSVEDTGRGIPSQRLASIFQPFEQIDGGLNRRYGGSGLGLSIVKGYCERLGGRVEVNSTPGQGSTFTVWLPFQQNPADEPELINRFADFRAMVVDERLSFQESVKSRLNSLGITVIDHSLSIQQLLASPPPQRQFDALISRDLSPDAAVALRNWALQVISLETWKNENRDEQPDDDGVARLWCGASRETIAALLETRRPTEEVQADTTQGAASTIPGYPFVGKRVLVVEDFEINREIMAYQLRSAGFQVIEAEDGDEAVCLAMQRAIDLILMDIQMPGKDGITAIREIRQCATGSMVPIIGFTASADKATHERVIEAGADRVLTKPISEAELVSAVQGVLMETRLCG